jgi:tRNA A64-2'-O-ribosylphosphate transferase
MPSPDANKNVTSGNNTNPKPSSRDKKKSANHPRDRLLSIQYDVEHYLRPLLEPTRERRIIVANERCGNWYAFPFQPDSYCHFKSTDGHVHLFSLKRLNLPLLKTLSNHENKGPVWILDASNKKELPDSFSRTLPIWACVLNRVAQIYRNELDPGSSLRFSEDDLELGLPSWGIVPEPEEIQMRAVIDTRVQELVQSQAIVDRLGFLQCLTKPLRIFWITPLHTELPTLEQIQHYHCLVCCNASNSHHRMEWREDQHYWYTPGAADDEDGWARHLTPSLFWNHQPQFSASWTPPQTIDWIDRIVQLAPKEEPNHPCRDSSDYYDWIGSLDLAIGTRRAGRPPECWNHFDAILNVTNTEYDEMKESIPNHHHKFYLQLPVEEGKRDKQELEKYMALGIVFCAVHAQQKRRILIHCAQGRDRSLAVAMAVVQLFCVPKYPLVWKDKVLEESVRALLGDHPTAKDDPAMPLQQSGLPAALGSVLLDRMGPETLLTIVRGQLGKSGAEALASKDSLRVVLHLIRQDREKAEPARSTMQKLNRFFMSSAYNHHHTKAAS